jgi:excisionase family DNA binding protein
MTTERAARYLSALDAARYLGVSRRTFFVHVRKNVPCVQIGARVLFDTTDLDRWVEINKRVPAGGDVAADMAIGEEVAKPLPGAKRPASLPGIGEKGRVRAILQQLRQGEEAPKGMARAHLEGLRKKGLAK